MKLIKKKVLILWLKFFFLSVSLLPLLGSRGCLVRNKKEPSFLFCPPVVTYNTTTLKTASQELTFLPKDGVLVRMLSDYAVMRQQARSCSRL